MTVIHVTADDIARGRAGSVRHCPLALAIARGVRREAVTVWPCSVYLGLPERGAREVLLPREATDFLSAVESGLPVAPFAFELPA